MGSQTFKVANLGPGGRGYLVCSACGWAEAAPAKAPMRGQKGHRTPWGGECRSTPTLHQLGHDFLTDVVEVRFATGDDRALRSTLYALLEGAGRLGIKRDEIDGTLYRWAPDSPESLVIFDAVPGGAGHARRIKESFATVVDAALERVRGCECASETSCYGCLRSYGNQIFHEYLSRGAAEALLAPLRP